MLPQQVINTLSEILKKVTESRLQLFFDKEHKALLKYPAIKLSKKDKSALNTFIIEHRLNNEELIILLLALMPHVQPNFLDSIIQQYLPNGGEFPEIGGVKGSNHRGTIPTGETALFILAGNDINKRIKASAYFSPDHFFAKENILSLEDVKDGEPHMSGKIIFQQEYVDLFTTGIISKPVFGAAFPAKLVTTKMEWGDLVLNPKTALAINDIKIWLEHNSRLINDWKMDKRIKPGYRALFYGPPGTGKTLTATLLGKQFNKDVYRIDLSQVVSKYIGETEKNLEKIFIKAEHKDWILFFDEADALFGKRSNVQNAHDKYANQEVSYLLQRVEDFSGLIILASNYKSNIDQAFIRRFNTIIQFPMPDAEERYKIWKSGLPQNTVLSQDANLENIAAKYELSGSSIVNVIHYVCLKAMANENNIISKTNLLEGIKREYDKEDRVFKS
ncbi:MAG: ATP-binding protein [Chitinophagaceae bacterium]|nr:ATP-binding protein [Chitinophagaceae bacterium]